MRTYTIGINTRQGDRVATIVMQAEARGIIGLLMETMRATPTWRYEIEAGVPTHVKGPLSGQLKLDGEMDTEEAS